MAEKVHFYYTLVQHIILFFSLFLSIRYWNKIRQSSFKLIPIYLSISLIISIPWYFKSFQFPGIAFQNIFIVFEFFIFYNFYKRVLKEQKIYRLFVFLNAIFIISIIMIIIINFSRQAKFTNIIIWLNQKTFTDLYVIEGITIVIPVLFYYKSIFSPPFVKDLKSDPVFLVMTGILFCFTISIPVFAFQELIFLQDKDVFIYLYIINSFSYIIMYLFFIKAFRQLNYT